MHRGTEKLRYRGSQPFIKEDARIRLLGFSDLHEGKEGMDMIILQCDKYHIAYDIYQNKINHM